MVIKIFHLCLFGLQVLSLITALEVQVWNSEKGNVEEGHDLEDECECQTGAELCYSDRVIDETKTSASNSSQPNLCGDLKDAESHTPNVNYMKIVTDRSSGKEFYYKIPDRENVDSENFGRITVKNAVALDLALDCSVGYFFTFTNITNVTFERSGYYASSDPCRGGSLRGFNVTVRSHLYSFNKIKLTNSNITFVDQKMGIERISIKNSTITNLNIFEFEEDHMNKIESSVISNLKALHYFNSFKIINSSIYNVHSESVRVENFVLENTKVFNTTRNGFLFMDSIFMSNVNFENVEQYGISFMPEFNSTISIKNLKIESCEVPCMQILEMGEPSFSWDIVNVTINGEFLNTTLGNYLEIQDIKHPVKINETEPELVTACREENRTLSCDYISTEYTYMHFTNYTTVKIRNTDVIHILRIPCNTNTLFLKNVSVSLFNADSAEDKEICSDTLLINATDLRIQGMNIERDTQINGKNLSISDLVTVCPLNISHSGKTDIDVFRDSIIAEGNQLWRDVFINIMQNVNVLGNWTIENSILRVILNLTIKKNLTIIDSNLGVFTGVVSSWSQLNVINCTLIKTDHFGDQMFIEEGAFVNLDGSIENSLAFHHVEITHSYNLKPKILVTSYNQVVGKSRWYVDSSIWVPLEVQIKLPQSFDPHLPVFGSVTLLGLLDGALQKYLESNETHSIYDFNNDQQIDMDQINSNDNPDSSNRYDFYDLIKDNIETIIYKNANVLRVQMNEKFVPKKIIFRDITNIVIYEKTDSHASQSLPARTSGRISLDDLELQNVSSTHLEFNNVKILKLNRTKIGTLSSFINQKIEIFDSFIELLSVVARDLHFVNLTILRVERLLVDNEGIISNCIIGSFGASGFLANEKSNLKMVNVTIGSIDREGIILLNKFHLENVTIGTAASGSIVLNPTKNPILKNVNINGGDEHTFKLLMKSAIVDPSVTVNGRKFHFNARSSAPSFEITEFPQKMEENSHYKNLKYFGQLFIPFVFGIACTTTVMLIIYWRRKSGGSAFLKMDVVSDNDDIACSDLHSVNIGQSGENMSADEAVFRRIDAASIRNSSLNDNFMVISDNVNLVVPDDRS